ncbi:pseudouridine synthase [Pontibacter sp. E15-1]|uniref:pseudouridine synthase n=1 Tax=Pontibacter sp. E15-1 TaxID=2919918 RepID=UPI001F4F7126|nr:pseudouridine synthase [Pontibacter sp. E15-1]MCJ8164687.1 pseudouridine synthase [Pontibacter sp. E15-1]
MKTLTYSLQHYVVQKGGMSNKEAVQCVLSGRVLVNGRKGLLRQTVQHHDEVRLDGQVLKAPQMFTYMAFHKPRGIESTLNPNIRHNLLQTIPTAQRVYPVGRLDKESEGLMLLTNDGQIYGRILHAEHHQEKEYSVTVNKPLTPEAITQLAAGVVIMGQQTRPARIAQLTENSFTIVLTQGLNRQIRRMCYKLGYQVQQLVRTRMVNIRLGELQPGQWRDLSPSELQELRQIVAA